MTRIVLACLACCSLLASLAAEESLIEPGVRYSTIDTEHVRAFVPTTEAERLRPIVARAEVIYSALARDAGYEIKRRLYVLFADELDSHNGFSFVTPYPLIRVDLAPAVPPSTIFDGYNHIERTLTHELTHHLTNDRNYGFRRVLESIFGRILPYEPFSLIAFYLSTPAHQTMPPFWLEGLAQWAETAYAPTGSPWGGRGRDSLSHMVWRLDADLGYTPEVGDWRLTYTRWPFGTSAYLYGLAYLRYLDGAYGQRAGPWQLVDEQARQWPFRFTGGVEHTLGKSHVQLLREARAALLDEQTAQLRILRTQPVTAAKRLTPLDTQLGAPAWLPDGRLFAAVNGPDDDGAFAYLDADGTIHNTWKSAYSLGPARSLPDGTLVYHEADGSDYQWTRSRVRIIAPDGNRTLPGKRLIEPDVRRTAAGDLDAVAVQLQAAGQQALMFLAAGSEAWKPLPTRDRPWTPTFRPRAADTATAKSGESSDLAWVETDVHGSRLMLAHLADLGKRTVLAEVPGRILHPVWNRDGTALYVCADHSGVSNAYLVEVAKPGQLTALTNTIGGIIACVPSPDGQKLAVIDHDRRGPFLAIIADDPAKRPKLAPQLTLAWPAPVAPRPVIGATIPAAKDPPTPHPLPVDAGPADLQVRPYRGALELRPLFWTPTTFPVPDGGYGVIGVAEDPLQTHQLVTSIGVSPYESIPVGLVGYTYAGWPIDVAAVAWQSERTYVDQITDSNLNTYNYSERVDTGELRIGYGLLGLERRWQAFVAAGIAEYNVIPSAAARYAGQTIINTPPFTGNERYVEATLAYDDALFFPTSYAPEDGNLLALTYRHSGFDGDLRRDQLLARGTRVVSVWPSQGHQLVLSGIVGWSQGDRTLQGNFTVGSNLRTDIPRGYDVVASGDHLLALSGAYRLPLWRPFMGVASSPAVARQLVLETFFDAAKASSNHLNGDGQWYRSVGGELHACFEFATLLLQPGVGVAWQLDGDKDTVPYFVLDFRL